MQRQQLQELLEKPQEELAAIIGAKLLGYISFDEGLHLTDDEFRSLSEASDDFIRNRRSLAMSNQSARKVLAKIMEFSRKCDTATSDFLTIQYGRLQKVICVDFDYCNVRSQYQDEIALAMAVAAALETSIGGVPAAEIAVYLIKKQLDTFCGCK